MNSTLPGSRRWRLQYVVQRRPAVQDEDHAYDLRHDASQVWGLTTGTYYAQALLRCHDALIPQNDAFRLCVVVTDGQIDEDRYAQCVDDVRQPTMTYTANMTGDYYDAGEEIFKDDCGWHASRTSEELVTLTEEHDRTATQGSFLLRSGGAVALSTPGWDHRQRSRGT